MCSFFPSPLPAFNVACRKAGEGLVLNVTWLVIDGGTHAFKREIQNSRSPKPKPKPLPAGRATYRLCMCKNISKLSIKLSVYYCLPRYISTFKHLGVFGVACPSSAQTMSLLSPRVCWLGLSRWWWCNHNLIVFWVFYTLCHDSGYKLAHAQSVCTRPFSLCWGQGRTLSPPWCKKLAMRDLGLGACTDLGSMLPWILGSL